MIETYKLMTGKYDYEIVDFMPNNMIAVQVYQLEANHLKLYRQKAEKNLRNHKLLEVPDNVVQAPNTKRFESRLD